MANSVSNTTPATEICHQRVTEPVDKSNHLAGICPHYDCEGRPMTPTAIGYAGAAFYRHFARIGADVESKIEFYPSFQWGLLV